MTQFAVDQDGAQFSLTGVSHVEVDGLDVVVHFLHPSRAPRRIGPASCAEHAQQRATAIAIRSHG